MAAYLNFNPVPFKMYPSAVLQQAIVALLIPLLAALWPLYNSVRITVRDAISDYGIGGNAQAKDASVSKRALFIPRPMRLSLRNAFRRKLRLGMTLTIIGALTGPLMTRPTEAQLAAAREGGLMTTAGAHTVGGVDGGPGVPVTGWSRESLK